MSPAPLLEDEIVARIERTRPDVLRATAAKLETAEDELFEVRGRMNGVISDSHTLWDSDAGRAFGTTSEEVVGGLAQAGYTLGYLARQLRAHAAATEQAYQDLQPLRTDTGAAHPYWDPALEHTGRVVRIVEAFRASETRVRDALFTRGEQAPGELPVPLLPAPAEQSWWESLLFGQQPLPAWVDADGNPIREGRPFDAAYGYDEEGNLVPAHRASSYDEYYRVEELGIGAIFRFLRGASAGRAVVSNGDEFIALVTGSHGWRAAHVDRHIREFYNLPPNSPLPAWAKPQFTDTVRRAGEQSGKVFTWELPPAPGSTARQVTHAILYRDRNTNKWLAVQFYRDPPRAGEFATAFEPTARQLTAMLQQNALR